MPPPIPPSPPPSLLSLHVQQQEMFSFLRNAEAGTYYVGTKLTHSGSSGVFLSYIEETHNHLNFEEFSDLVRVHLYRPSLSVSRPSPLPLTYFDPFSHFRSQMDSQLFVTIPISLLNASGYSFSFFSFSFISSPLLPSPPLPSPPLPSPLLFFDST